MRKFLFGVAAVGLLMGGVAYAEDFIVVGSTDPRIVKSSTFNAGERINIAKGSTVTVINSAGALTTLTGREGGVVLPQIARRSDQVDHFAAIRALLERPQARRTFGAMRGGRYGDEACPKASELTTIDAILAAEANDCVAVAQEALANLGGSKPAAPVSTPISAPAEAPK